MQRVYTRRPAISRIERSTNSGNAEENRARVSSLVSKGLWLTRRKCPGALSSRKASVDFLYTPRWSVGKLHEPQSLFQSQNATGWNRRLSHRDIGNMETKKTKIVRSRFIGAGTLDSSSKGNAKVIVEAAHCAVGQHLIRIDKILKAERRLLVVDHFATSKLVRVQLQTKRTTRKLKKTRNEGTGKLTTVLTCKTILRYAAWTCFAVAL